MGVITHQVLFGGAVPAEDEVLLEFHRRAGARLLASLRVEGRVVHATVALGARGRPYLLQILVERGGILLDGVSGLPSGEILPAFARVPWEQVPWDERIAAERDFEREYFPEEVWAFRLRAPPLGLLLERDPAVAQRLARLLDLAEPALPHILAASHQLPPPARHNLLTTLVALACHPSDLAQQELGRSALAEVPLILLNSELGPVLRSVIDVDDPTQVRTMLETVAASAYTLFPALAHELSRAARPAVAAVALELLAEAAGAGQ